MVFIYSFEDGFAMVRGLDDKYNLINKNGEMVSPNQWFDFIYSFKDGFAKVRINNKIYMVDLNNKSITELE